MPEEVKPIDPNTQAWMDYFQSTGVAVTEQTLAQNMQAVEAQLSTDIPTTKGMIWQNNRINPAITPEDFKEALALLQQNKAKLPQKTSNDRFLEFVSMAQAPMDSVGPAPDNNVMPMGSIPQDVTMSQIQNVDPDKSNHQGVSIAAKFKNKKSSVNKKTPQKPVLNMDDRILGLVNLIESSKK